MSFFFFFGDGVQGAGFWLCIAESAHKVRQNQRLGGAEGVKHVIHQNKINKTRESSFCGERCKKKKKMFAANLPVVTVNIPEPGWSLDLPLSATAVTTPVGCRFAAGHAVFTWK